MCISPPKLKEGWLPQSYQIPQISYIQSDLLLVIHRSEVTVSQYVQCPQEASHSYIKAKDQKFANKRTVQTDAKSWVMAPVIPSTSHHFETTS